MRRIDVAADSMRVGKTTAVAVIAEGLRAAGYAVTESYEDWQHNPYLKKSYSDPAKNFLDSQKWFARRKWEQVRTGVRGVFVQDVAPEMDYNYAKTNYRLGRMGESEFGEYERYYQDLDWSKATERSLLVYLEVSDEVLVQRAVDSAREFETVEPEYYLMMKRVNRAWIKREMRQGGDRILCVDTDRLDFARREEDKMRLVEMVREKLGL